MAATGTRVLRETKTGAGNALFPSTLGMDLVNPAPAPE